MITLRTYNSAGVILEVQQIFRDALLLPRYKREFPPGTVVEDRPATGEEEEKLLINEDLEVRDQAKARLTGAVATLRGWETDAANVVSTWDGMTTAQRFAALKVVVQRLGSFMGRMADLLEAE